MAVMVYFFALVVIILLMIGQARGTLGNALIALQTKASPSATQNGTSPNAPKVG